jgi:hypothetical protein
MNLVIYRGPLERTRLAYLFETLIYKYSNWELIWIAPIKIEGERLEYSEKFIHDFYFDNYTLLQHRYQNYFQTQSDIKSFIGSRKIENLALIGFSALEFGFNLKAEKKTWFVNGIPEEKGMSNATTFESIKINFLWSIKRWMAKRFDMVITVSERMNGLIKNKLKINQIFSAPTCVDTTIFNSNQNNKNVDFCYLGSGATWQAMDLTSEIWTNLYQLNPAYKFRVISRDPRTKILSKNIPDSNIEYVSSNDFKKVANYIAECKAGFLIRKDHIVNRVCFPTKLAEYLASDCWVVTSNIDWDVKDYFEQYQIGVMIDPEETPGKIAAQIFNYCNNSTFTKGDIEKCTWELDRENWKIKLSEQLP